MIPTDLPAWVALLTAALVLLGAGLTLVGALGLLRLRNFYDRMHAPTLGATLGIGCVLLASMVFFSALQTRAVLHEVLIAVVVLATAPVTLMLLARAALYRDQQEGRADVPAISQPANAAMPPREGEGTNTPRG
jgi:multicomponent K+:H+ antiporter subunit G